MEYKIPIKNVYYLFCYAWDRVEEGKVINVDGVASPELLDLFGKVLADGIKHLVRRGLDRSYVSVSDDVSAIRGSVNFAESMHLITLNAPRLHCTFDELLQDIPNNQIIKSTITRLAQVSSLDRTIASDLRRLSRLFDQVSAPRLSKEIFRNVHIHRNNAFYDFLIRICELIYDATLPEEGTGAYKFKDILRDERKMAKVFEHFVRNFYRLEQTNYKVTTPEILWDASGNSTDMNMLPHMYTDIVLSSSNKRIIIDTKYYTDVLQTNFEKRSVKSGNLYQLFAYLKNAEAKGGTYLDAEGMLLYPVTGENINIDVSIQKHRVRIQTINLDQDWKKIKSDLLGLLELEINQSDIAATSDTSISSYYQ